MPADYLDHLATLLRCHYLSDLRQRLLTHAEAMKILTEPVDYPSAQYLEAARYLLPDDAPQPITPTEAKQAIVAHLQRHS